MPRFLLSIILSFLVCVFGVNAQPYSEGKGYELVRPVQPTRSQDKVEVIEFFWYGCPHCYRFEPFLHEWKKTLADNVELIRQPAIFGRSWAMHAKAYFTAEALDVVDKVHDDLFDLVQNKKQKLQTETEIAKFFADHGVAKEDFTNAFNSFIVDTKMRQATSMSARYGVTGVPAMIVNGKYRTGGEEAKGIGNVTKVVDFLIKKESSDTKQIAPDSAF